MHKPLYTLITGASSGLGKQLAIQCASRKMNLVLVALHGTGLLSLSEVLQEQYAVDVITIETDLCDPEACRFIYEELKEHHIAIQILINNAGAGGTFFFDDKQPEVYAKLIHLNVTVPTLLCRLFLQDLKSCRQSYILNVSSLVAFFRFPKKQVYAATKTFLLAFSESLGKEVQSAGVHVAVLCPGGMDTTWEITLQNHLNGTWISKQSVMTPARVAYIAIKQLLNGKKLIIPGIWNRFFVFLDRIMPSLLKDFLIDFQSKRMSTAPGEHSITRAA